MFDASKTAVSGSCPAAGGREQEVLNMKRYLVALSICVMLMSCFFGRTLAMAGSEKSAPDCLRYYKTIEIESGDSLWSIAKEYSENSGLSIRDYIKEIKTINCMGSDRIQAGDSITVVYFASAPDAA